jgi:hypothetical protein
MENINFSLIEKNDNRCVDNQCLDNQCLDIQSLDNYMIDNFLYTYDIDELKQYYTSFTIKGLNQILQYYGLSKNKMVKDEMIQMILFFETETKNKTVVDRRIRLWSHVQELKADPYFSKYILF